MRKLKVLIACKESQRVCTAFRELGHEAYSADILEPSGGHPERHILGDVLKVLKPFGQLGLITDVSAMDYMSLVMTGKSNRNAVNVRHM